MQILQRPYNDLADNSPEFWIKSLTNKSILAQAKKFESLLAVNRKYKSKKAKFHTLRLTEDLLICFSVLQNPNSDIHSK